MRKKGTVLYNGRKVKYMVDENRYVWFYDSDNARINIGQVRPLDYSDNVEEVIIEMLVAGGF